MFTTTLVFASFAIAQPPANLTTLPLYPGKAPFAVGDTATDKPTLTHYPVAAGKANGTAAVVCPGGGYAGLAIDHEGKQVAEFLNSLGIHAFVLKYRVANKERPGPLQTAPLLDAQRAIRMVRSKAAGLGIDPKKIGIIGFSAGGHLASTAGTHFDDGLLKDGDAIDKQSCRPDFMVLGYPVITMKADATHAGSRRNLLGNEPDAKLVELFSNEKQVTEKTPPTFIFHTSEDVVVLPENAVRMFTALKAAKVPVEFHMYEKGRHGVGINPKTGTATDTWRLRLADWLTDRGLAGKK